MIYTLGEILLDIIIKPDGSSSAVPGGSMLNASVSMAKKGLDVAIISELGKDLTGRFISQFLKSNNIITDFVTYYPEKQTSLALAFLDNYAKPSYSFYKTYPQIRILHRKPVFKNGDILAFASFYSVDPAIRKEITEIAFSAKDNNTLIYYDPNIRHKKHLGDKSIIKSVKENFALADIIKGSDEDFTNIFGAGSPDFWYQQIKNFNAKAPVIITMGKKGSVAFVNNKEIKQKALKTEVISTVGAGDAFNAGIIYGIVKNNKKPLEITCDEWQDIIEHATVLATKVCSSIKNYI